MHLNLKTTATDGIWIDIRKTDGVWRIAGKQQLSAFEADWATGEPSSGECAYLSKGDG